MAAGYDYERLKPWLFTDQGQRALLDLRDWVQLTLQEAGAFRALEAMGAVDTPSSQEVFVILDRLVELGELVELETRLQTVSQHRIYVRGRK